MSAHGKNPRMLCRHAGVPTGRGIGQRTSLAVAAMLLVAAGTLSGCGSAASTATGGAGSPASGTAASGAAAQGSGSTATRTPAAKASGAGQHGTTPTRAPDTKASDTMSPTSQAPDTKASDTKTPGATKKEAGAGTRKVPTTAKEATRAEGARLTRKEKAFAGKLGTGESDIAPAAIVELGHEACDRLSFLNAADPSVIPAALASGQIANAAQAIENLCPEFTRQQEAANGGFGDGRFSVAGSHGKGPTVDAGTYMAPQPTEQCSWQVLDRKGKVLSSGGGGLEAEPASSADPVLTVARTSATVVSSGCYAWLPEG